MVVKGASCEVFGVDDENEEVHIRADADGEAEPMRMGTDPRKSIARQVEEHGRAHQFV